MCQATICDGPKCDEPMCQAPVHYVLICDGPKCDEPICNGPICDEPKTQYKPDYEGWQVCHGSSSAYVLCGHAGCAARGLCGHAAVRAVRVCVLCGHAAVRHAGRFAHQDTIGPRGRDSHRASASVRKGTRAHGRDPPTRSRFAPSPTQILTVARRRRSLDSRELARTRSLHHARKQIRIRSFQQALKRVRRDHAHVRP